MVGLPRRVFDRGQNVFPLQIRKIHENFVNTGTGSEQFQNVGHADSHAANTRSPAALAGIDCNSGEVFWFHAGPFFQSSSLW